LYAAGWWRGKWTADFAELADGARPRIEQKGAKIAKGELTFQVKFICFFAS